MDTESTSATRIAYAMAADPECVLPAGSFLHRLAAELRGTVLEPAPGQDVEGLRKEASAWASEESARYRSLAKRASSEDEGLAVLIREAALGCAPLSLASGAWLQWLSSMAEADDTAALRALKLYAADIGVGQPRDSRGSAYAALLRQLHLAESVAPLARVSLDRRIPDSAFYVPAVLLLMSRRPEDFVPEILGADLCLRTVGLLPPLTVLKESTDHSADWTAIDPAKDRGSGAGTILCLEALDELAASASAPEPVRERARIGFSWALGALRSWSEELWAWMEASLDPAWEMAELLRLRAREGAAYHKEFQLEDRPLSTWLEEARTDPGPLVDALGRSRLVRPGAPERSPLVKGLVGEQGPMFRIFSERDLAVIERWIRSLDTTGGADSDLGTHPGPASSVTSPALGSWAMAAGGTEAEEDGREPSDLREAYTLLQRRTLTPAVRRYAEAYVHGWLARSNHRIHKSQLPLPERWTSDGLRPWLVEQHDRHVAQFEETEAAVPEREDLIEATVQQAPLTMIDGAWLQGFTDYELAASEIGYSLFDTYWDELGNGEPALNHPLIYRELVAEMGHELPPTGSHEFAQWDGFEDESFELPVYWLSIGRFPRTFLPEVLGLNLAMELSGVGGSYRRAQIGLKAYGFSTRFVDIHNTVDNVATGHAAWAADALDTYMSSVPAAQRPGAWARVRTGFRALNPPGGIQARLAEHRARRAHRN